MKTWRIASISGGIAAIGLLLLSVCQIYILNNSNAVNGLNELFGSVPLGIFALMVFGFLFIVALVAFPVFCIYSIPWFFLPIGLITEGKTYLSRLNKFNIVSLAISSILVVTILYAGFYAKQNT
jgi:hypothetical protein